MRQQNHVDEKGGGVIMFQESDMGHGIDITDMDASRRDYANEVATDTAHFTRGGSSLGQDEAKQYTNACLMGPSVTDISKAMSSGFEHSMKHPYDGGRATESIGLGHTDSQVTAAQLCGMDSRSQHGSSIGGAPARSLIQRQSRSRSSGRSPIDAKL